jgi:hypothetical protein
MNDVFHLIDLRSQAVAVQKFLYGKSAQEKIEWMRTQGKVLFNRLAPQGSIQTYTFESCSGIRCVFFFDGEEFIFVGDHFTFKITDTESKV